VRGPEGPPGGEELGRFRGLTGVRIRVQGLRGLFVLV